MKLLTILFWYSLAYTAALAAIYLRAIIANDLGLAVDFLQDPVVAQVRMMLLLPCILFWIVSMRHWYRLDKRPMPFVLLLFFTVIYGLFYYPKLKALHGSSQEHSQAQEAAT